MFDETPFTSAQRLIDEACAWLAEMLLVEGHPDRECASNEDSWEQAQDGLQRAIGLLEDNGRERIESGGQEVAGYGWVPAYETLTIDPDVAGAADALRAVADPLLRLDARSVVPLVTRDLVDGIRALLAAGYTRRIDSEQAMIDHYPEPEQA